MGNKNVVVNRAYPIDDGPGPELDALLVLWRVQLIDGLQCSAHF